MKRGCQYTFHLSRTVAARGSLGVIPDLRTLLRRAGRSVQQGELPSLAEFSLSVILVSDDELLALNRSALAHDYYTDILTFEIDRTETMLEAELYLSVDRARDNARRAHVTLRTELRHLVIHGVLHLAGYTDKHRAEKNQMQKRERFYLTQRAVRRQRAR